MLNQVSRLWVYHFLRFFILGVQLGIEDVLSNYNADGIEDSIERMDVVGHLREVVLHEEEGEVSNSLRNHLQTPDGLLGQLVEAVITETFPVGLTQVQQVVLAETAPPLALPYPQLQVAGHFRPHQGVEGLLLLLPTHLLCKLLLLLEEVFLEDVYLTLGEGDIWFLLDDWQFYLEEIFLLLLVVLPDYELCPGDDLGGEGGLDLLAHLLTDNGEGLDDDLQVFGGEEVVDDDIFGELLVVVL